MKTSGIYKKQRVDSEKPESKKSSKYDDTDFDHKLDDDDTDGFAFLKVKETIKEIIREILTENSLAGDYVPVIRGMDYTTINGLAYHLKEYGVDTTMSYKKSAHRLMVRRDHLSRAIEIMESSVDEVSAVIAERLKKTHFEQ